MARLVALLAVALFAAGPAGASVRAERGPASRQNLITQPATLGAGPWINYTFGGLGAPTVTNNIAAPDGSTNATQLAFPAKTIDASASTRYFPLTNFEGTGTYTFSVWVKTASGTGTLYFGVDDGSTLYVCSRAVDTTWRLATCKVPLVQGRSWYPHLGPNRPLSSNPYGAQPATQPALTVHAWCGRVTRGSAPPSVSPTFCR